MRTIIGMFLLTSLLPACRTSESTVKSSQPSAKSRLEEPKICAAMRGNGTKLPALFGAMAQVVEQHGVISRVAGGSSASIASMMYESMAMNPAVWQCGSSDCSDAEVQARLSLLLKSLSGLVDGIVELPEGQALNYFKNVGEQLTQDMRSIRSVDPAAIRDNMLTLLGGIGQLKGLANPELRRYLGFNASLQYRIDQIKSTIGNLGKFEATNDIIFYRPGLLNFHTVARIWGRLGAFYASYAPADSNSWKTYLDQCAEPNRGKLWTEFSPSCKSSFAKMLAGFFKQAPGKNRADDNVGGFVRSYISTAVILDAPTIKKFTDAEDGFFKGRPKSLGRVYDQVRFGYWGDSDDLSKAAAKAQSPTLRENLHWQKFVALEPASWEQALATSPAEPGLASIQPFKNGSQDALSFGGWANLFPAQLLKEGAECRDVFFITRIGDTAFDVEVSRLLGINEDEQKALYDHSNPMSSVKQSIASADHVICTDWDNVDAPGVAGIEALMREGYSKTAFSREQPSKQIGCY